MLNKTANSVKWQGDRMAAKLRDYKEQNSLALYKTAQPAKGVK